MEDIYTCAITQETMVDPVIAADGHSYERRAIEEWLASSDLSPMTGEALPNKTLIPNIALRQSIQATKGGAASSFSASTGMARTNAAVRAGPVGNELRLAVTPLNGAVHMSFTLPAELPSKPLMLIAILDVSGSMCLPAQEATGESAAANFSRLDLVKHSMKTAVELLRPDDYLMIITFSDAAEIVQDVVRMDDTGKRFARAAIDRMIPAGSTNLWGGLNLAIERASQVRPVANAHTALLLLTDGEPTAHLSPPRGISATLQRSLEKCQNAFTIHTFGYGYGRQLDSNLLRDIAQQGNGSFSYVPDGSMVGTVFIHFFCNLLSVVLTNVTVQLRSNDPSITIPESEIRIGFMRAGQQRDLYIPYSGQARVLKPVEVISVRNVGQYSPKIVYLPPVSSMHFQTLRRMFIDDLHEAIEKASFGEIDAAGQIIKDLDEKLRPYTKDPNIQRLRDDLIHASPDKGQILKSIQFWSKWGQHYLPGVWFAHSRQEKTNFKDLSMEMYSTVAINKMIDEAEETFRKLPPTQPSIAPAQRSAYSIPVDMGRFIDRCGGCFTDSSIVKMADSSYKPVSRLSKGDMLVGGQKVRCVVRFTNSSPDKMMMIYRPLGNQATLGITAWHPIKQGDAWEFPCKSSQFMGSMEYCEAVFNVMLERGGSSIEIDGIQCASLGHGLDAPVVSHPYFGTDAVLRDLIVRPGFEQGFVNFDSPIFVRDSKSGMICAIREEEDGCFGLYESILETFLQRAQGELLAY